MFLKSTYARVKSHWVKITALTLVVMFAAGSDCDSSVFDFGGGGGVFDIIAGAIQLALGIVDVAS